MKSELLYIQINIMNAHAENNQNVQWCTYVWVQILYINVPCTRVVVVVGAYVYIGRCLCVCLYTYTNTWNFRSFIITLCSVDRAVFDQFSGCTSVAAKHQSSLFILSQLVAFSAISVIENTTFLFAAPVRALQVIKNWESD